MVYRMDAGLQHCETQFVIGMLALMAGVGFPPKSQGPQWCIEMHTEMVNAQQQGRLRHRQLRGHEKGGSMEDELPAASPMARNCFLRNFRRQPHKWEQRGSTMLHAAGRQPTHAG